MSLVWCAICFFVGLLVGVRWGAVQMEKCYRPILERIDLEIERLEAQLKRTGEKHD